MCDYYVIDGGGMLGMAFMLLLYFSPIIFTIAFLVDDHIKRKKIYEEMDKILEEAKEKRARRNSLYDEG